MINKFDIKDFRTVAFNLDVYTLSKSHVTFTKTDDELSLSKSQQISKNQFYKIISSLS